jgi:hypothetical protein
MSNAGATANVATPRTGTARNSRLQKIPDRRFTALLQSVMGPV